MNQISKIDKKREIFALIFQLSNELQKYLDKILSEYDMTGKQFLLLIVIGTFENGDPTLGEITKRFGSSHQNVKQIAMKLEKKGYIEIKTDVNDTRVRRFKLTDKSIQFWDERDEDDLRRFVQLFAGIENKEIDDLQNGMEKIYENIKKL